MTLSELTDSGTVLQAVAEYDRLGRRAISRSLSVTAVTLGSHELESPHPVAADPFCGFLDGVNVLEAE